MTTAAFLGDSITGSSGYAAGFPKALADRMGWSTSPSLVWGWGGMGYLNVGNEPIAHPGPFQNRVQSDIIANSPDVVVIAGGLNDTGRGYATADVADAAALLIDTVLSGLPYAAVYVVSPYYMRTPVLPELLAVSDAIRWRTMERRRPGRPVAYIDTVADPWVTGSGCSGSPAGDGNGDAYTSADTTHPNAAGCAYYAARLAFAISAPSTGLDF